MSHSSDHGSAPAICGGRWVLRFCGSKNERTTQQPVAQGRSNLAIPLSAGPAALHQLRLQHPCTQGLTLLHLPNGQVFLCHELKTN